MLILSTEVLANAKTSVDEWVDFWDGPRVLVSVPDSPLDSGDLTSMEDRFYVLEYLQPPASASVVLCDVVRWLDHLLAESTWPLLYLAGNNPTEYPAQAVKTDELSPWEIQAKKTDGRLDSLLLGPTIVANPLLSEFFHFLHGREVNDRKLVDLLRQSLIWD